MLKRNIIAQVKQHAIRQFGTTVKYPIPAFALDIDGVLLKDGHKIGNSQRAIMALTSRDRGGSHPVGIPHIFLTNGGGILEEQKAEELSEIFQVRIEPNQVCLSHTPMRPLAKRFGNDLVCVVGMHKVKDVAEHYGFTNVITPAELKNAFPLLAPHTRYDPASFPAHAPPKSSFKNSSAAVEEAHALLSRISAVLVMHDSRDWYTDLQVVLDILVTSREVNAAELEAKEEEASGCASHSHPHGCSSHGHSHDHGHSHSHGGGCGSEAPAKKGGCGPGCCQNRAQPIPHIPLYFSNPDLLYSASYRLPRLAQGSFAVALNSLYKAITGEPIRPMAFGKPTTHTYRHADAMLRAEATRLYTPDTPIGITYGIGDNPAADIQGANMAGEHWASVLVQTGTIPLSADPRQQPRYVFENVDVAIHHLLSKHTA